MRFREINGWIWGWMCRGVLGRVGGGWCNFRGNCGLILVMTRGWPLTEIWWRIFGRTPPRWMCGFWGGRGVFMSGCGCV